MTFPNKLAFGLIMAIIVFTTIAYGAVHQPVLALFYIFVTILMLLWAVDGFKSGAVRLNLSPLQLPLYAAGVYGLVQVIPFGTIAETAGVSSIPRTISLDPFATQAAKEQGGAVNAGAKGVTFTAQATVGDKALSHRYDVKGN